MRATDVPSVLADRECPDFGDPSWVMQPVKSDRQVAIVSTAGLIQQGDRPFGLGAADYRVIDREDPAQLLMTHISTNFDRSGFFQDHEVAFPLRTLSAAVTDGEIGNIARYHYSFMGATSPEQMAPAVQQLVRAMTGEGTNIALLVPV